ncbi:MAG: threonine/serine exporter family protein [Bdellovibrionota bacterium]|nr:threonine/serine exporter family protein [Bdellovibrionota bacterium]
MADDLFKIKFIMKLAGVLHRYGASSDRIEAAMYQVAEKIKLKSEFFSLPTSFMGHFVTQDGNEYTRMLRLEPGKINLEKLHHADEMVDLVIDESISLGQGIQILDDLVQKESKHPEWLVNLSIMLLAAGVTIILKGSLIDALLAGTLGLMSGLLSSTVKIERIDTILEGVLCFIIGFCAFGAAHFFPTVNPQIVILSAIIYYIPGLSLTMAMGEISSQNLTAGTARLAGAIIILLKIGFGTFLGGTLAQKIWVVNATPVLQSTGWLLIPAVLLVASTFVISFQARWQETFWIVLAGCSTFAMHTLVKASFGNLIGTLIAGIYIGVISNGYSRVLNRPSLNITLPSIILLVPGSVGFKGFEFLFINQTISGINQLFNTFNIGLALVAGTYFGSLIIKPRRMI